MRNVVAAVTVDDTATVLQVEVERRRQERTSKARGEGEGVVKRTGRMTVDFGEDGRRKARHGWGQSCAHRWVRTCGGKFKAYHARRSMGRTVTGQWRTARPAGTLPLQQGTWPLRELRQLRLGCGSQQHMPIARTQQVE